MKTTKLQGKSASANGGSVQRLIKEAYNNQEPPNDQLSDRRRKRPVGCNSR
jgi:hypothetical protein